MYPLRGVRWILRIHHKNARNVFVFRGSLSNDDFQIAILIEVCFALHIGVVVFVLYFSSVYRFCTTVRCVRSEQKENIYLRIIREILNDKYMRHREVYRKCYLRGERQPIRLLCFRKTNT